MSYSRGHVVWGVDPFGAGEERPWVVLSDEKHPFHGEDYIVAPLTTTEWGKGIALSDDDWESGGTPTDSWVKPWSVTQLRNADVTDYQGTLTDPTATRVCQSVIEYLT